jgi:hypothetical protein
MVSFICINFQLFYFLSRIIPAFWFTEKIIPLMLNLTSYFVDYMFIWTTDRLLTTPSNFGPIDGQFIIKTIKKTLQRLWLKFRKKWVYPFLSNFQWMVYYICFNWKTKASWPSDCFSKFNWVILFQSHGRKTCLIWPKWLLWLIMKISIVFLIKIQTEINFFIFTGQNLT